MKRFASLTALLLTLVLVLSLAACGDKNTADDNQTTDQPGTTLAPTNPAVTSLYLTEREGKAQAVEMVPQIPGQTSLDLEEQAMPSALKVIRFP